MSSVRCRGVGATKGSPFGTGNGRRPKRACAWVAEGPIVRHRQN